MANKLLHSSVIALILFFIFPGSATENLVKKYDIKSSQKIIKKYKPFRPSKILTWSNNLGDRNRNDIKNDYFNISYPKCFKVEPVIEDSEEINNKTSAALNFFRTETCPAKDNNLFMSMSFRGVMNKKEVEAFEKKMPILPQFLYMQRLLINGAPAEVEAEILSSRSPDSMFEPELGWKINVMCKGKNIELFQLGFVSHRGDGLEKYLENGKFDLPEDFKQIISSFQCRKDR